MYRCGTCGSQVLIIEHPLDNWQLSCGNGHRIIGMPGTRWVVVMGRVEDVTWSSLSGDSLESILLYEDRPPTRWERIKEHFGFERKGRVLAYYGRETSEE